MQKTQLCCGMIYESYSMVLLVLVLMLMRPTAGEQLWESEKRVVVLI